MHGSRWAFRRHVQALSSMGACEQMFEGLQVCVCMCVCRLTSTDTLHLAPAHMPCVDKSTWPLIWQGGGGLR